MAFVVFAEEHRGEFACGGEKDTYELLVKHWELCYSWWGCVWVYEEVRRMVVRVKFPRQ